VRQHAALGAALAGGALDAEQVRWVRHHHERWDAADYPDGPSGDAIPTARGYSRSPTRGTR
jgi:response regulator RpfG family c-di-GMP phosphodiesterase